MTTAAAIDRTRSTLSARLGRFTPLVPLAALLLFQQIRYPAPSGIVINGALAGGRIALIAVGIALIYRANRIINFAQGDLGAVPATLGVMLVVAWGWNYWLGLASGLAAAILLGVLVETLIVRRFFTAPRLVLTVATIGLSQVLAGAGLFLPRAFGNDSFGTRLEPPIHWDLPPIGGTTFNSNDILTAIVVPICLVGLALFLYTSTIGIAIVGAAERADRAFTLGIPVKRLHTVVWVVASVLAFLAMFLRAGAVGLPIGQVLSPIFLLQALAACVFGRFERFTMIGAAAIGIGIVDQAMTFQPGSSDAKNAAVLFYIILIGLLVTRRSGTGRVDMDSSTTWQATREIRPVPREMRRLPEVVWGRILLWAAVAIFVVSLPFWLSTSRLNLATIIVIFGIVAASLVVLTGWAGQVSLGQMAFVGVGAAVGGALTEYRGWDLMFSMPVAGLVGGLAAVVVGYPALRRRGLTLAVSTLGFGLYVSSYILNRGIFDWLPSQRMERGVMFGFLDLSSEKTMFFVSLGTLLVALGMVASLRRTRTGRVLIAIRENERAARAYGVNATRTSLAAFALSGFLAAMAGALYVQNQTGLSAESFLPDRSLAVFTMVVIGGLGSLAGALLGTAYVFTADFFLPAEWQFLASGVGLLLVLLLMPSGFGGVMADVRDAALRRIALRRGLVVPSLLADVRIEEAADEPPAETVLAAAGEKAEAAEGPAPAVATPQDAPVDAPEPVPAPVAAGGVSANGVSPNGGEPRTADAGGAHDPPRDGPPPGDGDAAEVRS
jgi:ABC-type branched-subunit amino acid transport system permease subunit